MYQVIVGACHIQNQNPDQKLGIGIILNETPMIPWIIRSDIDHFRNTTIGNFVLMGRITWESIPNEFKPLSNRINIIISSKADQLNETKYTLYNNITNVNLQGLDGINKAYDYIHFVSSIEEGFNFYRKCIQLNKYKNKELFVIGGETIYKQMIEKFPNELDKLYMTEIYCTFPCTTFFPIDLYLKKENRLIFEILKRTDKNILSLSQEKIEYGIKVYKFKHDDHI